MISIGRLFGHDQKFYDLLEASAQQADTSVHHLVDLLAKIDNKSSAPDLAAFAHRAQEPDIPLADVVKKLKAHGKL